MSATFYASENFASEALRPSRYRLMVRSVPKYTRSVEILKLSCRNARTCSMAGYFEDTGTVVYSTSTTLLRLCSDSGGQEDLTTVPALNQQQNRVHSSINNSSLTHAGVSIPSRKSFFISTVRGESAGDDRARTYRARSPRTSSSRGVAGSFCGFRGGVTG